MSSSSSPRFIFPPPTLTDWDPMDGESLLSSDQTSALQAAERAAASRMKEIDADIARLQVLQRELEKERTDIDSFQKRCLSVLSNNVLRQLPLEILGEIFSLAQGPKGDDLTQAVFSTNGCRTALRLSLVCKTWRRAALATPKIWARLLLSPSGAFGCRLFSVELLELYLARSHQYPLDIFLDTYSPVTMLRAELDRWIQSIYRALAVHSQRWRSVAIHANALQYLSTQLFMPGQLPLPAQSLHSLEILRLLEEDSIEQLLDCFHLSNVRSLHVSSEYAPTRPWQTLCARLPSLRILRLSGRISLRDGEASARATLPHITTLKLDFESSYSLERGLDSLVLPCLGRLEIDPCRVDSDDDGVSPAVVALVHRSKCELQELVLRMVNCLSDLGLVAIFEAVPDLKYLSVEENFSPQTPTLTPRLFQTLTSSLLPQLQRLHLTLRRLAPDQREVLKGFAENLRRSRPGISTELLEKLPYTQDNQVLSRW